MPSQQDNGIVLGVVESLVDREGLGRVRVKLVNNENALSSEARISTPFGGKNRGLFCKPEPGDEVLVAYERGDPRRPYILGALWSKEDPPPPDDGQPEANNWRFLHSRSGHILRFDDTAGSEKIEIIDKDGQRRLVIDASRSKIRIECDQGDIEIKAQASVKVEATTVEVKASGNLTMEAGGKVTIKGATVDIN